MGLVESMWLNAFSNSSWLFRWHYEEFQTLKKKHFYFNKLGDVCSNYAAREATLSVKVYWINNKIHVEVESVLVCLWPRCIYWKWLLLVHCLATGVSEKLHSSSFMKTNERAKTAIVIPHESQMIHQDGTELKFQKQTLLCYINIQNMDCDKTWHYC